ncbi:hypothetical protein [Flavobacterium sp.]|uniref:hypothetical protein n=1 Tax=Flavobacterium sp. TaxID=239 RepID=UPI002B4ABBB3|nr:hypothetical protein [Flavobacterium sp.]HLF51886.1 hypothetical protein [Flavobacterium sp.]
MANQDLEQAQWRAEWLKKYFPKGYAKPFSVSGKHRRVLVRKYLSWQIHRKIMIYPTLLRLRQNYQTIK